MADDDIEDSDFDDDDGPDELEYEINPPDQMQSINARRELEKRLEMKRLKEMIDSDELDDDF